MFQNKFNGSGLTLFLIRNPLPIGEVLKIEFIGI